jgi:Mycoplasma protein of unknown function, DUF285
MGLDYTQFAAAKYQNYDYCRWGQLLPKNAVTRSLFIASGCPNHDNPDITVRRAYCVDCSHIFNISIAPTTSPLSEAPLIPQNASFAAILNRDELLAAVDSYLANDTSHLSYAALQYGYPIGMWDVSQVTDFSGIFHAGRNPLAYSFNEDLRGWNTSAVESMAFMFTGAAMFNGDVSLWSTGRVTRMTGMCKFDVGGQN